MVVNSGYIGGSIWNPDEDREVSWRCFYDATATPVGPTQPIVNGPNGFAFEADDLGSRFSVRVWRPNQGSWQTVRTPAHSTVRFTVAQLAAFGVTTRGDVKIEGPVED